MANEETALGAPSINNYDSSSSFLKNAPIREPQDQFQSPTRADAVPRGEGLRQELDQLQHVADGEATPAQEDVSARRETGDVEAVHPAPSGPAYSVFSGRQRQYIVFMVACGGFFSPLSANIYFPALNSLSKDLSVSNELINLSLTTYMIFQGLAPTVFGDLADMTGRRPVYILGFIIYIGANVGLALQNNYAALLVLRCLQSTGSSGTVALGNGVVADIASIGERGKFMGTALIDADLGMKMLTIDRYCSIWPHGRSCNSTGLRRHPDPIFGLEMALLVLDDSSSCIPHTLGRQLSRDWPQRGW